MRFSHNWLHEFVPFTQNATELANLLTRIGHNVDSVTQVGGEWTKVVIGAVLECEHITGSDHLTLCRIDVGSSESLAIVCGAPNVAPGQVVPVALVDAELPGGLKISGRKVKGVLSRGMICSECELGLSAEGAGIMVLDRFQEPTTLPSPWKLGVPLEDYIGKRDWIYDVEITINRGDCLSHLGLAREIAGATGLPLTLPTIDLIESEKLTSDRVSVDIIAPERCPRYSARMITSVNIAPSPYWLQERLRNLGVRPISNVVDVTNYVMLELGHPLHAFDYHLIPDGLIIVRSATSGERFTTLDGKEHALSGSDLLIADKRGGIALAGVMGGLNSEIKADTHDVLLECAVFERTGVRFTSRDRGISSESSHRFERGVDPEMTPFAVSRSAHLIQQAAGGQVLRGIVDNYPGKWQPTTLTLRPTRVVSILAMDIPASKMAGYLQSIGCEVTVGDLITVKPPSWRHDLEREIDLIEEVARLHGYDYVPTAITSGVPLGFQPDQERRCRLINRIKSALVELGFHEAITLSLISPRDAESIPDCPPLVRVVNPISEELSILRPSLLPPLLAAARRNLSAGCNDIRLFEWGACFQKGDGSVVETNHLAGVLMGSIRPESWNDSAHPLKLHDLKGLLEQFAAKISLDKANYIYYDITALYHIGLGIAGGDKSIPLGWLGELNPAVTARYDLDRPVFYFELDGDRLLMLAGRESQYHPLPRYPSALRDLSFLAPSGMTSGELEETIRIAAGSLLEQVELFDLYEGKNIPTGMKALTYHLTFRSPERTLSDDEVDAVIAAVTAAAVEKGAGLRAN
jgi:phenylalanyl-tRNA synthetase beta chain